MSITNIEAKQLREMTDKEGLILQGCGGDPQEWLDGINDMLTEAGILQNGSRFTSIYVFQMDNLTNILYPFDDVDLHMGKLAMWRLRTHDTFGGTWLSDYITNQLSLINDESQYATDKPDCALIGQDGNIFNLVGIASHTLKRCGLADQAKDMSSRVMSSGSYNEALAIIGEYVNITDAEHVREFRPSAKSQPLDLTPDGKIPAVGRPAHVPENYLLNAELKEEAQTGNYNMLDGRMDNIAPESAGEKASVIDKLKVGQPKQEPKERSHSEKSQEREL